MKCSKCGRENQAGLPACAYCGASLLVADPFYELGDLTLAETEMADEQPKAKTASKLSASEAHTDCFRDPGDLSGERTSVEKNNTKKTVDQQLRYDSKGRTGFANLGDLSDGPDERKNVGADTKNSKKSDDIHANYKNEARSKERKTDHSDGSKKQYTKTASFSKKKWLAIAASLAIVLLLAVGLQAVSMMKKSAEQADERQAVAALDEKLNIPIKEIDTEGIETPKFLVGIEKRNGYEILSFEKTENGAAALVRVYAPDVYGVAKELDANGTFSSEAELADALNRALEAAPIVERQVSINYILTEEGYVPNLTAEFLDAYYGGVYQLRDEMMAEAAKTEG